VRAHNGAPPLVKPGVRAEPAFNAQGELVDEAAGGFLGELLNVPWEQAFSPVLNSYGIKYILWEMKRHSWTAAPCQKDEIL